MRETIIGEVEHKFLLWKMISCNDLICLDSKSTFDSFTVLVQIFKGLKFHEFRGT